MLRSWNNVRIDQVSDGIEAARLLGIQRLEEEIEAVDADGAVGVDIDFVNHAVGTGALLSELFCVGTAVRRYSTEAEPIRPRPVVPLRP